MDEAVPPVGHRVNELANMIVRSANRDYPAAAGVKVVEAWVLRQVGENQAISAREVAAAISVDEGQVSRAIKSLLDKGLIIRSQDPQYSRRKLIELTKSGRRTFKLVQDIYRSRAEGLVDGISRKEQSQFFDIVEKIRANADQLLDGSDGED